MRRTSASVAGLFLVIAALATNGQPAGADKDKEGEASTANELDGHENPPGADKNAPSYVNPCLGHEGYEVHISKPTGITKNDVEELAVEIGGETTTVKSSSTPGDVLGFSLVLAPNFQVEYVQWLTACGLDEDAVGPTYEPGSQRRYWIRRPTQESILPFIAAQVGENLKAPDITWPNKDPEFGWVYVTVENDIRISPVEEVYEVQTVGNLAGSVTVWVRATPNKIVFRSGEPGSSDIECSYEQATAPFNIDFPSSCFYKYENSSSIGTEVRDAFLTRTTLLWEITASGPLTANDPESWREQPIQVAAVQAIEIANP